MFVFLWLLFFDMALSLALPTLPFIYSYDMLEGALVPFFFFSFAAQTLVTTLGTDDNGSNDNYEKDGDNNDDDY